MTNYPVSPKILLATAVMSLLVTVDSDLRVGNGSPRHRRFESVRKSDVADGNGGNSLRIPSPAVRIPSTSATASFERQLENEWVPEARAESIVG